MDYEQEIASPGAETIALQAIISNVLRRLANTDPVLANAIRVALNDAASEIETIALHEGVSPDHVVEALRIVEELRSGSRRFDPIGFVR
jgi:hypothetical protein